MLLYGDVLRGAGHEIDGFTDPLKAYFYFNKKADQYDAVITDVMMNGMSGLELAKKLKEINSDVKILLMSAFEKGNCSGRISAKAVSHATASGNGRKAHWTTSCHEFATNR
jgi:CheY-like chemotaxis protein